MRILNLLIWEFLHDFVVLGFDGNVGLLIVVTVVTDSVAVVVKVVTPSIVGASEFKANEQTLVAMEFW